MKKPFSKRTDIEKLQSNWTKTTGLFDRGEFSVSIIRAATSVEIAANFAVRHELRSLPSAFVDSLLVWANGLGGKFQRLLLPITKGHQENKTFDAVWKKLKVLNRERNAVTHSGAFRNKATAETVLGEAREAIEAIIRVYKPHFTLKGKTGYKDSHRIAQPRRDRKQLAN